MVLETAVTRESVQMKRLKKKKKICIKSFLLLMVLFSSLVK